MTIHRFLMLAALGVSSVAGAAGNAAYTPDVDPVQLLAEQRTDRSHQIAAEAHWSLRSDEQGVWRRTEAGHTWTAEVRFPDTQAVGFAAQAWPQDGITVTVDGQPVEPVRAPSGTVWLGLEPGATVGLSLTVAERAAEPMVAITRWQLLPVAARTKQDGQSDPCHLDMACRRSTDDPHSRATAMIFIDNIGQCTGSLMNNTAEDGRRLMLSAAHCLGNDNARPDLVRAYFRRESSSCHEDAPLASLTNASRVDAVDTKLATHQDGWLFELGPVPLAMAPYLMGWDASGTLPNEGTAIQHAGGRNKQFVSAGGWMKQSFESSTGGGRFDVYAGRFSDGASRPGASGASWSEAGDVRSFGVSSSGVCQAADGTGNVRIQRFSSLMEHPDFRTHLDPLNQGVDTLGGVEGADFEPAQITISVHPSGIDVGERADIVWEVQNGDHCVAGRDWSGNKPSVGGQSTGRIDEPGFRVYRLTCENPRGQTTTAEASLGVSEAGNAPGNGLGGNAGDDSGGGSAGWLVLVPLLAGALRRRRMA